MSTSRKKSSFIFQYFLMSMSVCFTDVQALEIAHKYMVIKGNNFLAGIFWFAGSRPPPPSLLYRIIFQAHCHCVPGTCIPDKCDWPKEIQTSNF